MTDSVAGAGPDVSDASIARVRVSDQVVSALREAVLTGELRPGEALREIGIAERYEVSRGTVREAIRALENEGLVSVSMHRGASVRDPTPDDVRDIYAARLAIEPAAALAVTHVPDAVLTRLRGITAELEAAVDRDDRRAAVESDLAFHSGLVALRGSTRLDAFYANLQLELRLLLIVAEGDAMEPDKVAVHRRLADLAADRDGRRLAAAVTTHVEEAGAGLLRLFSR